MATTLQIVPGRKQSLIAGVALGFLLVTASVVLAQSATGPLPPLAPPYGQLPPTFWEQHSRAVIAAALALVTFVAGILWFVIPARPAAAAPPAVAARAALQPLRGQSENGKLLSEISQIVRNYFAAVLQLAGAQLTTAEFSIALASTPIIDAPLRQALVDFLRECDQRKFSADAPGEPLRAVDRALAVISEMEQQIARTSVQSNRHRHD